MRRGCTIERDGAGFADKADGRHTMGVTGLTRKRAAAAGSAATIAATAMSAGAPLAVAGAAVLRQQFEKMRATEPGTRLGDDIEALHQMRVATRRLRAALRIFVGDELRPAFEPIEADVRTIARALGAVRDLDVFGEELRSRAGAVPADSIALGVLLEAGERVRSHRREELLAVLDGPAAMHFWEAFPGTVDLLERASDAAVTVRRAAPRLIRRRLKKVTRAGDGLHVPTSTELHELRIGCKRLRYACEFFKPWFARPLDPIIEAATGLQDTLGALHDGDVMPETLHTLVSALGAGGSLAAPSGRELAAAVLGMVRDRQQKRDELLLRFRNQWAAFREIGRSTRLKAA